MIKDIQNNPFFTKNILKQGEYLFRESESDTHIYIINNGKLVIEKELEDASVKLIAQLEKNDIFGEGGLSGHFKKDVSIKAISEAEVYSIDANDFKAFIKQFPTISQKFLTKIIELSNTRLLASNKLVIKNYEIAKLIAESKDFSNTNLFTLLDTLKEKLEVDSISFFERNRVLENYISFHYTTNDSGKMKDDVFNVQKITEENLSSLKIVKEKYLHIAELKNSNQNIGYLVFGKQNSNFSELSKKVISSLCVMLAGYIKQKQILEDK